MKGTQIPGINYNYPNYNWLINGDCRVSQRGDYSSASSATTGTYYIDRWKTNFGTVTFNKQHLSTNQPSGLNNCYSIRLIATNTVSGWGGHDQFIEDYASFSDKKVTFSVWVKSNNADARLVFYDGVSTITSSGHTGGGDWELLTLTTTVDSSATTLRLSTYIIPASGSGNSVITTGDYIEFTGAKLEIGPYTPFESRPFAEELRLCQRYFIFGHFAFKNVSTGSLLQASGIGGVTPFPVQMRTSPTISRTDSITENIDTLSETPYSDSIDWNGRCNGANRFRWIGSFTADAEM